jgi:hypothetical protein
MFKPSMVSGRWSGVLIVVLAAVSLSRCEGATQSKIPPQSREAPVSAGVPDQVATASGASPASAAASGCPSSAFTPTATSISGTDAWATAQELLGPNVRVLRPRDSISSFGPPALLSACTIDGVPQYEVEQHNLGESIAFCLTVCSSANGNFPGPPTRSDSIAVRGTDGALTVADRPGAPSVFELNWEERGSRYTVRMASRSLAESDLIQIVNKLQPGSGQ